MDVKLIVVGGKASKGAIPLKLPTVVGRSREADLTVSHPMVSRRHCEIFDDNGLLSIRDLGSLNGTIIDGRRILQAALCPEDEFTVGPLTFRAEYRYDGPVDEIPPPKFDMRKTQPSADVEPGTPESQALDETPKLPPLPGLGEAAEAQMPSTVDVEKLAAKDPAEADEMAEFDQFEEVDDLDTDEEEAEPEPSPPPPLRNEPAPATKPAPPKKQGPWSTDKPSPAEVSSTPGSDSPAPPEATPSASEPAADEPDDSDEDFNAFLQGLQED